MTYIISAVIIGGVVESFVKQSLLYDFYGSLLTGRQREIYEAWALYDYSPAEIADGLDISRQAVHDIIRRTNAALEEYEEKLRLVEKFLKIKEETAKIESCTSLDEAKQTAKNIEGML